MPILIKSLSCEQGHAVSNRYQVKRFKNNESMHTFQSKQFNNDWKESELDLKSGTYFQQYNRNTRGFIYINFKELSL